MTGRVLTATLLLAAACTSASARDTASQLHETLEPLESRLGAWQEQPAGSNEQTVIEYRAALGGRFVEAWQQDAGTGALRSHSMIAADPKGGALTEYRFDQNGRLTVARFDVGTDRSARRLAVAHPFRRASSLDPSLDVLRTFLGEWEVATDWFDGGVLWARMSNQAELDGRVVRSIILAAASAQAPYDRYRTFYFRDEADSLRELTFTYKGNVVSGPVAAKHTTEGTTLIGIYDAGTMASIAVRKQLTIASQHLMRWTDDFRDESADTWERAIDAHWIRTGGPNAEARTMPIDDALFVAAGSDLRSVTVERSMDATPAEVWDAWTTEAGWKASYAPDRPEARANIELAPGGKYEWLFDGTLGCNGCQVLSYLPHRMLSVTWNAPVAQPLTRVRRTWLVVEIEPGEAGTSRVRTTHLGFGVGQEWDETLAYFQQGWTYVLERMASSFAKR